MIKFIGWMTVVAVGLYTGILQALLAAIGFTFIWVGSVLSALVI